MEASKQEVADKKSLMGLPRNQLAEALQVLDIPEKQKICALTRSGGGFTIKVLHQLMK